MPKFTILDNWNGTIEFENVELKLCLNPFNEIYTLQFI